MGAVTEHTLDLPCCGEVAARTANATVDQSAASEIKVYPNPANATVYFEFPKSADVVVKIMDITGHVIDQVHVQDNTMAIFDVKSYAPGLYIYQVITNGKTQSGKLQVK